MTNTETSAAIRIQKDLLEMISEPHPWFSAEPLPNNLFEWHVNIMGTPKSPYSGTLFHLKFVFPPNYPLRPPQVSLYTPVNRSHVYGSWICLDMLETHRSNEMYSGWSTAYSIYGIILQLSSFLLMEEDEGIKRNYKGKELEIRNASKFQCPGCPHDMRSKRPWPINQEWAPLYDKQSSRNFDVNYLRLDGNKRTSVMKVWKKIESLENAYKLEWQQLKDIHQKNTILFVDKDGIPQLNMMMQDRDKIDMQKAAQDTFDKNLAEMHQRYDTLIREQEEKLANIDREFEELEKEIIAKYKLDNQLIGVQKFVPDQEYQIFDLPSDAIHEIFSYLKGQELVVLQKASKGFSKVIKQYSHSATMMEKPICFYNKKSMDQGVLGIGIVLRMNPFSGLIGYIDSTLDFLSWEAYDKDSIREGVWREKFTHFLPMYLNRQHGKRSIPIFEECIMKMTGNTKFEPQEALDVLCKLMNTQVVNVMKGVMHNSSKSLYGYSLFHRWLIYLVQTYPSLQKYVDQKVDKFRNNFSGRNKRSVEVMGEFFPLLSVSKIEWEDLDVVLLNEVCARNVLWALKSNPELGYHVSGEHRAKICFASGKTMFQMIMYHVYFLKKLARPKKMTLKQVGDAYDQRLGAPSFVMQEEFQQIVFRIQKVKNWSEFLTFVGIPVPDPQVLDEILVGSVLNSALSRYHYPILKIVKKYEEVVDQKIIDMSRKPPKMDSWSPWLRTSLKPITKEVFEQVIVKRGVNCIPLLKKDKNGDYLPND